MAEKKDLKYSFEIDSTVPEVLEGDPERFTQIINNVLSNAVKFTHFGKIDCNIKSTTLENNIAEIAIIIKDTGIGIKDSQINNLFNSFGQMRLNDKRSFGGVGLGLSITKHLIDLFKGSIEIDSEENRGTSVTVSLPLKVIQQNKIEVENPDISKAEIKVLVVEDNTMNQLIMKKILKTLSINNFQIASNGVEAIKLLENNTFDVILMDLQMPEMDGYETTTIIRNDITMHSIKNIPIIAVTADATDTAREKVIDVGMNDYITKPVNRDLLYRKILTHRKNELKIA